MYTAIIKKRSDVELLQPVECPYCGYHFCGDATFDRDVKHNVACPGCKKVMHLPDLMDLESFLKSESSFEQLQEEHRCSSPLMSLVKDLKSLEILQEGNQTRRESSIPEEHRCSTLEDYWYEITFQSIFKDDVIESSGRWNFVTGEIQVHEWNKDLPKRKTPVEEMFHDLDRGGYSRAVCPCCHKSSMKTDIGEWAVDIKHEYAACANPECDMHGKNIGAKL